VSALNALLERVPTKVSVPVLAATCAAAIAWATASERDVRAFERRVSASEREMTGEMAASRAFREEMLRRTDRMEDKIDRLVEKEKNR
jgi:hypothetical protein